MASRRRERMNGDGPGSCRAAKAVESTPMFEQRSAISRIAAASLMAENTVRCVQAQTNVWFSAASTAHPSVAQRPSASDHHAHASSSAAIPTSRTALHCSRRCDTRRATRAARPRWSTTCAPVRAAYARATLFAFDIAYEHHRRSNFSLDQGASFGLEPSFL